MLRQYCKIDPVIALRFDALLDCGLQDFRRLTGRRHLDGRDLANHLVGHNRFPHDLRQRRAFVGFDQQRIELRPPICEQVIGFPE
jgi:hypothetical protein